jgi:aminoglycoside phosphotransferase (APT) family kinase protein
MSKNPDDLKASIEAHLAAETGENAAVRALEPLGGGACQDNYRVEVTLAAGELAGDHTLVLRSDAVRSLPGSIDRQDEFAVIGAAVRAGVKTPKARFLARDLVRPGAYAYFLDWAEGTAIGRRVLRDASLADARRGLARTLAIELAKIHTITPATEPAPLAPAVTDVLAFTRGMVEAMREPRPALFLALRWLEQNPPESPEITLVHGDFRTGNFMVTPQGLSAILDWEFAHWGSPFWDIAWITMRDWRFGQNKLPVGGFAPRAELYEAYEEHSGRKVSHKDVHYCAVLANVRWAAGCSHQGERYLSGQESDLELIAIPRRGVEMEFEALRLIEKGAA